ncbi:MAG: hypothetical protein H7835_16780 [Magnetococcus sp. XQGC-1]
MNSEQKQLRRHAREQLLEEGLLTLEGRTVTVDILDVSFEQENGQVWGFGLLVPGVVSPQKACVLQLPVSRMDEFF